MASHCKTTPCVEDSVAKIVCFCTTVFKHFRRELPHVTSAAMACAVCKAIYFFGYTFFLRNFDLPFLNLPFPDVQSNQARRMVATNDYVGKSDTELTFATVRKPAAVYDDPQERRGRDFF